VYNRQNFVCRFFVELSTPPGLDRWDRSMMPRRLASIIADAGKRQDDAIAKELDSLYKEVFDKDNARASASQSLKAVMRRYRAFNGAGEIRQAHNDQDPWPD
jgi:hypothetical protein